MQIKEITIKETWENFLAGCNDKTFMQSWNWGEFHEKMGHKIWRLGLYEQDELAGIVLVVKVRARRGTFLTVEHGPVTTDFKFQVMQSLLGKLIEVAKQESASFIRISPIWERNE